MGTFKPILVTGTRKKMLGRVVCATGSISDKKNAKSYFIATSKKLPE